MCPTNTCLELSGSPSGGASASSSATTPEGCSSTRPISSRVERGRKSLVVTTVTKRHQHMVHSRAEAGKALGHIVWALTQSGDMPAHRDPLVWLSGVHRVILAPDQVSGTELAPSVVTHLYARFKAVVDYLFELLQDDARPTADVLGYIGCCIPMRNTIIRLLSHRFAGACDRTGRERIEAWLLREGSAPRFPSAPVRLGSSEEWITLEMNGQSYKIASLAPNPSGTGEPVVCKIASIFPEFDSGTSLDTQPLSLYTYEGFVSLNFPYDYIEQSLGALSLFAALLNEDAQWALLAAHQHLSQQMQLLTVNRHINDIVHEFIARAKEGLTHTEYDEYVRVLSACISYFSVLRESIRPGIPEATVRMYTRVLTVLQPNNIMRITREGNMFSPEHVKYHKRFVSRLWEFYCSPGDPWVPEPGREHSYDAGVRESYELCWRIRSAWDRGIIRQATSHSRNQNFWAAHYRNLRTPFGLPSCAAVLDCLISGSDTVSADLRQTLREGGRRLARLQNVPNPSVTYRRRFIKFVLTSPFKRFFDSITPVSLTDVFRSESNPHERRAKMLVQTIGLPGEPAVGSSQPVSRISFGGHRGTARSLISATANSSAGVNSTSGVGHRATTSNSNPSRRATTQRATTTNSSSSASTGPSSSTGVLPTPNPAAAVTQAATNTQATGAATGVPSTPNPTAAATQTATNTQTTSAQLVSNPAIAVTQAATNTQATNVTNPNKSSSGTLDSYDGQAVLAFPDPRQAVVAVPTPTILRSSAGHYSSVSDSTVRSDLSLAPLIYATKPADYYTNTPLSSRTGGVLMSSEKAGPQCFPGTPSTAYLATVSPHDPNDTDGYCVPRAINYIINTKTLWFFDRPVPMDRPYLSLSDSMYLCSRYRINVIVNTIRGPIGFRETELTESHDRYAVYLEPTDASRSRFHASIVDVIWGESRAVHVRDHQRGVHVLAKWAQTTGEISNDPFVRRNKYGDFVELVGHEKLLELGEDGCRRLHIRNPTHTMGTITDPSERRVPRFNVLISGDPPTDIYIVVDQNFRVWQLNTARSGTSYVWMATEVPTSQRDNLWHFFSFRGSVVAAIPTDKWLGLHANVRNSSRSTFGWGHDSHNMARLTTEVSNHGVVYRAADLQPALELSISCVLYTANEITWADKYSKLTDYYINVVCARASDAAVWSFKAKNVFAGLLVLLGRYGVRGTFAIVQQLVRYGWSTLRGRTRASTPFVILCSALIYLRFQQVTEKLGLLIEAHTRFRVPGCIKSWFGWSSVTVMPGRFTNPTGGIIRSPGSSHGWDNSNAPCPVGGDADPISKRGDHPNDSNTTAATSHHHVASNTTATTSSISAGDVADTAANYTNNAVPAGNNNNNNNTNSPGHVSALNNDNNNNTNSHDYSFSCNDDNNNNINTHDTVADPPPSRHLVSNIQPISTEELLLARLAAPECTSSPAAQPDEVYREAIIAHGNNSYGVLAVTDDQSISDAEGSDEDLLTIGDFLELGGIDVTGGLCHSTVSRVGSNTSGGLVRPLISRADIERHNRGHPQLHSYKVNAETYKRENLRRNRRAEVIRTTDNYGVVMYVEGFYPLSPSGGQENQAAAMIQRVVNPSKSSYYAPGLRAIEFSRDFLINGFLRERPSEPICLTPAEVLNTSNNRTEGVAKSICDAFDKQDKTGHLESSSKMFVKNEQYHEQGDEIRVRCIVANCPGINTLLGCWMHSITEEWKRVLTPGLYYTSGLTPTEMAAPIQEFMIGGPVVFIESDCSAFDSTITLDHLQLEEWFYSLFPNLPSSFFTLFRMQYHLHVKSSGGLTCERVGGRASGVYNTSLGNTFINLFLHYVALRRLGLSPLRDYIMLALGDDNFLVMRESCFAPAVPSAITHFLRDTCCMLPEVIAHPPGTPIECASYCSGYFGYDESGQLTWSADAVKQIVKGLTVKQGKGVAGLLSRLDGYKRGFSDPLLRVFGDTYSRALDPSASVDLTGINPWNKYSMMIPYYNVKPIARESATRHYGVDVRYLIDEISQPSTIITSGSHPHLYGLFKRKLGSTLLTDDPLAADSSCTSLYINPLALGCTRERVQGTLDPSLTYFSQIVGKSCPPGFRGRFVANHRLGAEFRNPEPLARDLLESQEQRPQAAQMTNY